MFNAELSSDLDLTSLVKKAKGGHVKSVLEVIKTQMQTVTKHVKAAIKSQIPSDELTMEGIRGISRAIEVFDVGGNAGFHTVAEPYIRLYIRNKVHADSKINGN